MTINGAIDGESVFALRDTFNATPYNCSNNTLYYGPGHTILKAAIELCVANAHQFMLRGPAGKAFKLRAMHIKRLEHWIKADEA